MVHFVGAGCGAKDLITVRGARLLKEADCVLYAGSPCKSGAVRRLQARLPHIQYRQNDARGGRVRNGARRSAGAFVRAAAHWRPEPLRRRARADGRARAPENPIRRDAGGVELLRRGGGAARGVYAAGGQPDGHPDAGARAHGGAGRGIALVARGARAARWCCF